MMPKPSDPNTTEALMERATDLLVSLERIMDPVERVRAIMNQFLAVEHAAKLYSLELFDVKLREALADWKPPAVAKH